MNSLDGDHQVVVVDVDEGVLEGSDMSGTHLNGFLCEKGGGHDVVSRGRKSVLTGGGKFYT